MGLVALLAASEILIHVLDTSRRPTSISVEPLSAISNSLMYTFTSEESLKEEKH